MRAFERSSSRGVTTSERERDAQWLESVRNQTSVKRRRKRTSEGEDPVRRRLTMWLLMILFGPLVRLKLKSRKRELRCCSGELLVESRVADNRGPEGERQERDGESVADGRGRG